MATFTLFNSFKETIAEKVHNLQSDALTVALTNSLPVVTNTVLTDITEISYTNLSSRILTVGSSAQTSGTYKLVISNLTLTASGAVPTFRYAVIYNATATNKELIGFVDLGSTTLANSGDNIVLQFDATNGLLQIA